MNLKWDYMTRTLQVIALLVLSLFASPLWAKCSFTSGSKAIFIFNIPSITVPQDARPGTVLYSGNLTSANSRLDCTSSGKIWQGYKSLYDSDYVSDNPLIGVYATNVPGVGIRATWVNTGSATFANGSYIKPYALGTSKVEDMPYSLTFNALVELVVTGPVQSGDIDVASLQAQWVYDGTEVAVITFVGSTINVASTSCDLVEKDLVVNLRPINTDDFVFNAATGVTNDPFYIELANCNAGISVDLTFSSSGSSGLVDNYTLANSTGANMAQGVGIQMIGINKNIVEFNKAYIVKSKTVEGDSIRLPFTARYVKTGDIVPGLVNAIATFEVNYR
ncbi:fimbrial protein [Enterobacter sp. 186315]